MIVIILVFLLMSLVAAFIGIGTTRAIKIIDSGNQSEIMNLLDTSITNTKKLNILERTANLLTVNDFYKILSKDSIIAIILFAIIFGFAVKKSKSKGDKVKEIILSLNDIVINIVNIIMYYAPVGLGCYIASLIGTYGGTIAVGFLKTFIIYTLVCLFVYIVVYSIYALIAGGTKALKIYWKSIIPSTFAALATCSSAACIPINIKSTKEMGISDDIAETTIPMGTSFHKDGSVIGSAFKIMFLVYLFQTNTSLSTIIITSILATLLITAVPIGGGTISEMFILQLLGFPTSALPILAVIATIIDAPATVLNVVGDASASLLVGRIVDGKNFLKSRK